MKPALNPDLCFAATSGGTSFRREAGFSVELISSMSGRRSRRGGFVLVLFLLRGAFGSAVGGPSCCSSPR